MAKTIEVSCKTCGKSLLRSKNKVNENLKLKHNFYCSNKCQFQNKKKRKIISCNHCGRKFERILSGISPYNYCSRTCSSRANNKKFPKKGLGFRICSICGTRFKGENLYCSKNCFRLSRKKHNHEELISVIKLAAENLRRTPTKRELREVSEIATKFFGSWNKAISASGLIPYRSHSERMYKRLQTKAKDGHFCDSISEAIIDNWLIDHDIQHIKGFPYPSTNHKADWKIDTKTFIEYFGLAKDSPRYDRAVEEKKELCRKNGIKLIEIYPQDLYPKLKLDEKFIGLI